MDKTKEELEACVLRLLKSDKPKMIVGVFHDVDIKLLPEEKWNHFKAAEYLWQATPHKGDQYKGLHMGVLLDEELKYVHIIFASPTFMYFTLGLR